MSFHISEEILYVGVATLIAGGAWFFLIFLKKIRRHCQIRRIQRGIANYCQQLSRG